MNEIKSDVKVIRKRKLNLDQVKFKLKPFVLESETGNAIWEDTFEFVDWDRMTKDHSGKLSRREKRIQLGRERFEIHFVIAMGENERVHQEVHVFMFFNDAGEFVKYETYSKRKISEEEQKKVFGEALSWLFNKHYVDITGGFSEEDANDQILS